MTHSVLIVDDEAAIREALEAGLKRRNMRPDTAASLAEARARLERHVYQLVLLDYSLGDGTGLELLAEIRRDTPQTPVIMITAHNDFSLAVECTKQGACDFVPKPFSLRDMLPKIEKAIAAVENAQEVLMWRRKDEAQAMAMVGQSPKFAEVVRLMQRIAESPTSTVLVLGESGTGKEVAAKFIHDHSPRKDKPFVALNCNALPAELFESELFGHVQGAFTGAAGDKPGFFELADGGTLFLDEIGDLAAGLQAKLLRVLQERSFYKVGGNKKISCDVRIVAATNKDLQKEVHASRFREDLYYRLNVISIELPPLRERREDIIPLAQFFLDKFNKQFHRKVQGLSDSARALLRNYAFPGNIRELQNLIERAVLLTDHPALQISDFASIVKSAAIALRLAEAEVPGASESESSRTPSGEISELLPSSVVDYSARLVMDDVRMEVQPDSAHTELVLDRPYRQVKEQMVGDLERRYLVHMLQKTQGRVSQAAEHAGMLVPAFSRLLRKHAISAGEYKV